VVEELVIECYRAGASAEIREAAEELYTRRAYLGATLWLSSSPRVAGKGGCKEN